MAMPDSGIARKKKVPLAIQMTLGLVLGIAFGMLAPNVARQLMPVGTAFIQAIKMIIVPLIVTVITLGVYQMGSSAKELGKVSTVSLVYFLVATVISIVFGLVLNGIFHPGRGADLTGAGKLPANLQMSIDWSKFFLDMIPSNIVAAMAGTNLLPVLVFAVALGLALAAVRERATPFVQVLEAVMAAIFKLTGWIIAFSPYAVFAIIAWLFATQGKGTIVSLLKLIAVLYLGLFILLIVLLALLAAIGERPFKVFKDVSAPILLGFGTRSSEVTLPVHLEKLVEMGVPKAIASVVLPLGYAFNRDASIIYYALAVGFLADAYHVPLTWQNLLSIIIVTTIATKGSANMPSGALVAIALVLSAIGLPVEAITIVAGVDAFMDMGRTAMNVFSNTVAVKLVMKLCHIPPEVVPAKVV